MFEKVNPSHPDKIADRIAGAIVDYAYARQTNPKIAVEVLIGHGECNIVCESSLDYIPLEDITSIVHRITHDGSIVVRLNSVKQDSHLALNQYTTFRCGDNGIFKGVPLTPEQRELSRIADRIYMSYPYDGKYILDGEKLIICQSHANVDDLRNIHPDAIINPLGYWTGGTNVDTGATNRKLGSDMADSVTGGGLHGKDLSKADVSVNIYAFLKAQRTGEVVSLSCAIGDEVIDGITYTEIVQMAQDYIKAVGGFEKFAEWGLV